MAMGPPLSAVAYLFMEKLEARPTKETLGLHISWMKYVEDVLGIVLHHFKYSKTPQRMKQLHPTLLID